MPHLGITFLIKVEIIQKLPRTFITHSVRNDNDYSSTAGLIHKRSHIMIEEIFLTSLGVGIIFLIRKRLIPFISKVGKILVGVHILNKITYLLNICIHTYTVKIIIELTIIGIYEISTTDIILNSFFYA